LYQACEAGRYERIWLHLGQFLCFIIERLLPALLIDSRLARDLGLRRSGAFDEFGTAVRGVTKVFEVPGTGGRIFWLNSIEAIMDYAVQRLSCASFCFGTDTLVPLLFRSRRRPSEVLRFSPEELYLKEWR
jgi:hypothetical protein